MGNVQPADTVNTATQRLSTLTKTGICTAITQSVMAAETSWMDTDMPDGAITPSAVIPVLSADIQNPVLIRTAERFTQITAVLSIKWLPNAVTVGSPTIPRPNLIRGTTAIGNPSLHPSMNEQNPATAADLPRKQSLILSAETSAPAADTVKKQHPL